MDGCVDRHECIQRRNAACIAKRATRTILRNIGEKDVDNACRSNNTGNVRIT